MSEHPSVHELMSKVMGEIEAIGKTERNDQQKFNFRGIDQVMNALSPILSRHGVYYTFRVQSLESERYQSRGGGNMRSITVTVEYTFHGPSGDSTEPIVSAGEAADAGDKAVPKALAQALKYALLHGLCIPTKEQADDDADRHAPEAAPPREAQVTPGIDPVVQGWIDGGTSEAEILEAAKQAARKHGGRVARTLEQVKPGYLTMAALQEIAAIVTAEPDPAGCADHNPYEPSCAECQHALKQREEGKGSESKAEQPTLEGASS